MATGSTATLVSSTMQLNGEFSQAYILDAIVHSPIGNLAIFIYIISAIGFFISVAIFQNYKMGLWLIFGPALWDISANTRTDHVNVNWMYAGTVVQDQEWLTQFSNESLVDDMKMQKGPASVYVMWDAVVSGAVQNLTGLLATITNDPATRLFAKTNIQEGMLGSMIQSPEIREAMRIAMGPDCTPMIPISKGNASKEWGFAEVIELEDALDNRVVKGVPEPVVRKLCEYSMVYSIWSSGSNIEFDQVDTEPCVVNPWGAIGAFSLGNSERNSCLEFSRSVWEALEVEAEIRLRNLYKSSGADASGVSALGRNVLPTWSLEMLAQDPSSLRKLTASYIIRNEMDNLNFLNPARALSDGGKSEASETNEVMAIIGWLEKESAQGQAVFFAKSVPYLQGALLYTLAIVYPFICIIMLIPGFHTAMITWMGAWAWVKSWDVMLYVISLLSGIMSENILHKGMLHNNVAQNQYAGTDGSVMSFSDNVVQRLEDINFLHLAVYKAFDDVDPKFVEGLINYIVALTTISIPAITGIFFLWGRASTLNLFSDGLKNKAMDATSRMAAKLQDQWLRDIEIDRQKDVRAASAVGTAFGAGIGFLVGGLPGALVGTAMGSRAGDKFGSVSVGYEQGGQAALYGNRPMVVASGDLLDPWESMTAAAGGLVVQKHLFDMTGQSEFDPQSTYANSPDTTSFHQNRFSNRVLWGGMR